MTPIPCPLSLAGAKDESAHQSLATGATRSGRFRSGIKSDVLPSESLPALMKKPR